MKALFKKDFKLIYGDISNLFVILFILLLGNTGVLYMELQETAYMVFLQLFIIFTTGIVIFINDRNQRNIELDKSLPISSKERILNKYLMIIPNTIIGIIFIGGYMYFHSKVYNKEILRFVPFQLIKRSLSFSLIVLSIILPIYFITDIRIKNYTGFIVYGITRELFIFIDSYIAGSIGFKYIDILLIISIIIYIFSGYLIYLFKKD